MGISTMRVIQRPMAKVAIFGAGVPAILSLGVDTNQAFVVDTAPSLESVVAPPSSV